MAQGDYLIQNQSFPSFRSDLNSTLEAINTSNSGTSRPTSAVAGTVWLDTTNATNPTLKFFDGTDDISLAQLDYSANTVNWLDSSVVADLVNDTTPQLGGDLDVNGNSIVSVSNGNITFTPDGTGKVIIDGLSYPTADGTSGQNIITDGAGNLSFSNVIPADNTVSLAKLTATGTKDATTFLRGDNTFAEAGGGSLVKLHSITTTDATTTNIDFDSTYITSTYNNYLITGNIIPVTDSVILRARFSESGTFQTGGSYYGFSHIADAGTGTNTNSANNIELTDSMGNANGEGTGLQLFLYSPTNTTIGTFTTHQASSRNPAGAHSGRHGTGTANTSNAHDGIRFFLSSGNFASGTTITLYGYEK
jgi:hypothetical protein